MEWCYDVLLRQRVTPTILLFCLIPASFSYLGQNTALSICFFLVFALIGLAYISFRFMLLLWINEGKKALFDSILVFVGVIAACCFHTPSKSTIDFIFILTCCTSIPLHVTNHRIREKLMGRAD